MLFKRVNNNLKYNKYWRKTGKIGYSIFRMIMLISIGYLVIYPVIIMITGSIKPVSAYLDKSIIYIPKEATFEYYKTAVEALDYFDSILSTLIYGIVSAIIEIAVCAFIAYGMARFDFKLKKVLNFMLVILILVPTQMIIIPMMMNYSQVDIFGILGLINKLTGIDLRPNILGTAWTFYLPSLFGVGLRAGMLIYIYMQFFKGLPYELEEAAWIDGAGLFKTFFCIAVPSSSVVFTTVSIFSVVWHWNEYFQPMMYLSSDFTLAVKIYDIDNLLTAVGLYDGYPQYSTKKAAAFLFIVPMLIVYLILQKKFVQSIDRVGITG